MSISISIDIIWDILHLFFSPKKCKKKNISVILSMFWWVLDCFWTRIHFCSLMGMKICCKAISHVTTPCLWKAYLTSFSFNVSDFNPSKLDLVKFSLLHVIAYVLSTHSTLYGLNLRDTWLSNTRGCKLSQDLYKNKSNSQDAQKTWTVNVWQIETR